MLRDYWNIHFSFQSLWIFKLPLATKYSQFHLLFALVTIHIHVSFTIGCFLMKTFSFEGDREVTTYTNWFCLTDWLTRQLTDKKNTNIRIISQPRWIVELTPSPRMRSFRISYITIETDENVFKVFLGRFLFWNENNIINLMEGNQSLRKIDWRDLTLSKVSRMCKIRRGPHETSNDIIQLKQKTFPSLNFNI